jgi:hypothetical protein
MRPKKEEERNWKEIFQRKKVIIRRILRWKKPVCHDSRKQKKGSKNEEFRENKFLEGK